MFIRIKAELYYLWHAVDQDSIVLDILVRDRREMKTAKRLFKRLLGNLEYVLHLLMTDELRSYGGANRDVL